MVKYDSYKGVDVEWIGVIPTEWKCVKLGFIFSPVSIKNTEGEINLSVYRDYGVIPTDSRDDNHNVVSEDISNYKLVTEGDFVMNKMKCWMGSIGISKYRGIVSPSYTVLKLIRNDVVGDFFHYLLRCQLYIPEYRRLSYGVRIGQWDLRFEDFREIKGLIPPIQEQTQIVQYLNTKIYQVDTLIQKTQEKINLLREKRTSLINHTVTKGLNTNVKMKDSRDEWIGVIPSQWKISRLDFLYSLFGRVGWKSLKSEEYVEDGYVFLSTPNIKNRDIDYLNVNYITKERYDESPEIMLENGDVLLVKDGSTLGIVNIVKELPRPTTVNSSIGVLKRKSDLIIPEYLYYFLSTHYCQNIISRIKGGMGVPHLFQSDIKKFSIFLPNLSEQYEIVEYLNDLTQKVDTIIQKEEKRIELLKEYRLSLISNVVTGKIKVCN